MAISVQQLKLSISKDIDNAFDKTINESNWPYLPDETVSFYDLMKLFQRLKGNIKECLNNTINSQ